MNIEYIDDPQTCQAPISCQPSIVQQLNYNSRENLFENIKPIFNMDEVKKATQFKSSKHKNLRKVMTESNITFNDFTVDPKDIPFATLGDYLKYKQLYDEQKYNKQQYDDRNSE